ncbi:MAG: DsbC family protein [Gammaproteobacteria bacterium]|nr:DsbC family protein [Gammaproteobacteria bacterium]
MDYEIAIDGLCREPAYNFFILNRAVNKMKFMRRAVPLLLLLAPVMLYSTDSVEAEVEADIAQLKEKYANVDEVRPTPVPGLYELRFGYRIAYVDASGQFGFLGSGDLQDVSSGENLTASRRAEVRRELLASLDEWDTLDFMPDRTEHELLVFTDVDCGYCRRLHQQMAEYHELGIGVRYVAFPRSGPDTDSWTTMQSIWCSDNRPAAMTSAKAGGFVPERQCDSVSVERHFELGREIGLSGTPALLTPGGELIPGYVPPIRLAAILNEEAVSE